MHHVDVQVSCEYSGVTILILPVIPGGGFKAAWYLEPMVNVLGKYISE